MGSPTRRQPRCRSSGRQTQGGGTGEEGGGCGGEQEGQVDALRLMNAYGYARGPGLVRASPLHGYLSYCPIAKLITLAITRCLGSDARLDRTLGSLGRQGV